MGKVLAELDFSEGVKVKSIKVPKMLATITCENPEILKGYDSAKEKVILQKLIAVAYEELKSAQKEIGDALEDFDAQYTKKPPATQKDADESLKTLQTVCGQITKAQKAKVEKAVDKEWELHKKRDAALLKLNLEFSYEVVKATLSLAMAVTAATLSMGALAPTLIAAAKTLVTTALKIKEFAAGRDAAAKDVIDIDLKLSKAYNGPEVKGKAFKSAKEIAAAAGIPFIDTVGKMEGALETFLAKSARVDKETQSLFEDANKLMASLKKIDADEVGAQNAKTASQMTTKVTSLLNGIGELNKSIDGDNLFYKVNSDRCDRYKEMNGKALAAAAKATAVLVMVAGIVSDAKDIVDFATSFT